MSLDMDSFKKNAQEIPVPEQLDDVISQAIIRGKKKKRKYLYWSTAAASAIVLFASLNTSTTFADYVRGLFYPDKGVEKSVANGYVQSVDLTKSDEKDSFSVKEVITDDRRMMIAFNFKTNEKMLEAPEGIKLGLTLKDDQGNILITSVNSNNKKDSLENNNLDATLSIDRVEENSDQFTGYFNIKNYSPNFKFPENMTLEVDKIGSNNKEWNFALTNIQVTKPVEYAQAQEFDIQIPNTDLKFRLQDVKLYPTLTTINLDLLNKPEIYDSNRGYLVINGHLEDEKGNQYQKIGNSTIFKENGEELYLDDASILPHENGKSTQTYEYEANSFEKPKELYLVIVGINEQLYLPTDHKLPPEDAVESFNKNRKNHKVNKKIRIF